MALFLFLVIILPIATLNMLGPFIGSDSIVSSSIRGLSHIMFFAGLAFALSRRSGNAESAEQCPRLYLNIITLILMITLIFISIVINAPGASGYMRGGVMLVFLSNILILVPSVLCRIVNLERFLDSSQKMFTLLCLGIFFLSLTLYMMPDYPYYSRLGYPLIPGVFAYYMTIAFFITTITRKQLVPSIIFLAGIVLSGSRSALGIALAIFLLTRIRQNRLFLIGVLLFTVLIIGSIDYDFYLRPYMVEREDITSGRILIWSMAIDNFKENYLLGYGLPWSVGIDEFNGTILSNVEETHVAHNSFLDIALTYGVFVSLMAYAIWFFVFFPRKGNLVLGETERPLYIMGLSLFALVTIKSLLSNTFWMNMSDPPTYFVMLFLLSLRIWFIKRSFAPLEPLGVAPASDNKPQATAASDMTRG